MFGKSKTHVHSAACEAAVVPEFNTGIMLAKQGAIEKDAKVQSFAGDYRPMKVYFRAGTKGLNWDYVRQGMFGANPRFFKKQADIETDIEGNPLNTAAVLGATGACGFDAPGTALVAPNSNVLTSKKRVRKPAAKKAAPRKR